MRHLCVLFPSRDSTSCHRLCWVLLRGWHMPVVHSRITPAHDDCSPSLLWLWPGLPVVHFTVESTACGAVQLIVECQGALLAAVPDNQPQVCLQSLSSFCWEESGSLIFLPAVAYATDVESEWDQSECVFCILKSGLPAGQTEQLPMGSRQAGQKALSSLSGN